MELTLAYTSLQGTIVHLPCTLEIEKDRTFKISFSEKMYLTFDDTSASVHELSGRVFEMEFNEDFFRLDVYMNWQGKIINQELILNCTP